MTEEYCKRLEEMLKICEQHLDKENEDICDVVLSQYLINNCDRKLKKIGDGK